MKSQVARRAVPLDNYQPAEEAEYRSATALLKMWSPGQPAADAQAPAQTY